MGQGGGPAWPRFGADGSTPSSFTRARRLFSSARAVVRPRLRGPADRAPASGAGGRRFESGRRHAVRGTTPHRPIGRQRHRCPPGCGDAGTMVRERCSTFILAAMTGPTPVCGRGAMAAHGPPKAGMRVRFPSSAPSRRPERQRRRRLSAIGGVGAMPGCTRRPSSRTGGSSRLRQRSGIPLIRAMRAPGNARRTDSRAHGIASRRLRRPGGGGAASTPPLTSHAAPIASATS